LFAKRARERVQTNVSASKHHLHVMILQLINLVEIDAFEMGEVLACSNVSVALILAKMEVGFS
jgi:hypothetical protein